MYSCMFVGLGLKFMYYLEYGLFLEKGQSLNGTEWRKLKCYYGRNRAVLLQFSL